MHLHVYFVELYKLFRTCISSDMLTGFSVWYHLTKPSIIDLASAIDVMLCPTNTIDGVTFAMLSVAGCLRDQSSFKSCFGNITCDVVWLTAGSMKPMMPKWSIAHHNIRHQLFKLKSHHISCSRVCNSACPCVLFLNIIFNPPMFASVRCQCD